MPPDNAPQTFTPLTGPGGDEPVPMDPRLQLQVALQQEGRTKPATFSTGTDEIAVIAKVSNKEAFEAMPEVRPGVQVGDPAADGTVIVTARVPITALELVRRQDFVFSLKAAQRLRPQLGATTEDVGARPESLPDGQWTGGEGVIVGIVDFGGDFAHRNFQTATGRTRLLALWDQNTQGFTVDGDHLYGTVHEQADIDAALEKEDPYSALGYTVADATHGTHVMDIAAGNGRGTGTPGVAPEAELIFVDLAGTDLPAQGAGVVGSSFGDSVQLLEALAFIFVRAGETPCVVNVSLGTNGGPHDGTTLVEQGIDRLLTQAPNRAVCLAAANSHDDGAHASGTVPATGSLSLTWNITAGDPTQNELEIWYPGSAALRLELVRIVPNPADGTDRQVTVGTLDPGQSGTLTLDGGPAIFAANRLHDPNNGDNTIGVFLTEGITGRWLARLTSTTGAAVPIHAWIERDDSGRSTFSGPLLDDTHTIGSISCGRESIVVGCYDAHTPGTPISSFSSAGPTRDGRQKPEVSAPGARVVAAHSQSVSGVTRKSGTSMASPAVTGVVANLLAEVVVRQKRSLTIDEIRTLLISTARGSLPAAGAWDPQYGFGRVSVPALLDAVSEPPPA
ncbi:S8 family serine peptidase [Cryptosporangium phraense]|uniref:S8 family serine peptidase n=1 Tax=Cryptosporangium phraense TaxID=2593070 RepID=A0A545AG59_9ACTN|nr:S8 family serine peptidase [Cryptosporangium phraense]TQS40317.1 S8 family serine peptidase [Cryptosporangium phraense]